MLKTAIIVLPDTHCNSQLGLCSPNWLFELNDLQKLLHQCYIKIVKKASGLKERGWTLVSALAGDNIDLMAGGRTDKLVTYNSSEALDLAKVTLKHLTRLCKYNFVFQGTEAHDGISHCYAETLGQLLGTERTSKGRYAWEMFEDDAFGALINIAHHPKGSLRFSAESTLSALVENYGKTGLKIPRLIIRGHNHRYDDTGNKYSHVRCAVSPGFQLLTPLSHRMGSGYELPDIGGLIVYINDGNITVEPMRFRFEAQRENYRWKGR
jgi:hypothetical protein